MSIELLRGRQILEAIGQLPKTPISESLFRGEMIANCDEALAIYDGDELVALATIEPRPEPGEVATPALYVVPHRRREGFATRLVEAMVLRCRQRGFYRIHVVLTSGRLKRAGQKLSPQLRGFLDVRDTTTADIDLFRPLLSLLTPFLSEVSGTLDVDPAVDRHEAHLLRSS